MPAFIANHTDWAVSGLIVLLGLLVYGLRDLIRVRPSRIWAIGTVCFRDAVRRRVLWITPLAMVGIVLVSQFQKPFDEQDAVRQTVKVCLFTTGLVVTIIALITAATNLPREIDNRVIFTIVTKPVTRLEIVVGKVVGFARVSFVILLVMGGFTLIYMHSQAWWLGRQISAALDSGGTEPTRRLWLEHFQDQGLLQAQRITQPTGLAQYARVPENDDGGWLLGGAQDAVVMFEPTQEQLKSAADPNAVPGAFGFGLVVKVGYEPLRSAAGTQPNSSITQPPVIAVQIQDPNTGAVVITAEQFNKSGSVALKDPQGSEQILIQIAPDRAVQLANMKRFVVQIICPSPEFQYRIKNDSVMLVVPDSQTSAHTVRSSHLPILRGSNGRSGQQLTGPTRGVRPVAIYSYRGVTAPAARNGRVPFELTVGLESSGNDSDEDVVGSVEAYLRNRKSGQTSEKAVVHPESRRTVFFDLPADFTADGDFDVVLENRSNAHTIGLNSASLALISGREYFGWNLAKALFVLWMLAVLTAMIAFWCSTFLSWPIAVVLSTLIVLGHWGVSNVDLGSGIGAQVANDLVPQNAAVASVVNTSVEKLSRTLEMISKVLPDVSSFGVTDQIERGTSLVLADMLQPIEVMIVFGLPLLTLSYVFLRNKEVAP